MLLAIALLVVSILGDNTADSVQSVSIATTTLMDSHPLSCGNYETPLWGWYERISYMWPATCDCPAGVTCLCATQAASLIHVLLSECCGTYTLNGPITQQFESLAIGTQMTVCGKLTAPSIWSGFAGDVWVTDWTTGQDFTLSLDPTSVVIKRGGTPTTVGVSVNSVGGFTMPVHLTVPSLPAGVSVRFSSNPVTPPAGGGAVLGLSIAASSSALEGTTILTVTGTSGMLTSARSLTLTVTSATATTVSPPRTSPQTTNATLEYDLTNGLTENGTTCTYEWGPMFTFYRSGEQFSFNYSSSSLIDVYVFDPDEYSGRVSCTFGPVLHAPYEPLKLTGKQDRFATACLGCEKEGGEGSSFYVLFINRDSAVIPHVTLQVAVRLYAATTTTTVNRSPIDFDRPAIDFIGVPETLIAILLGLFVVTTRNRRKR